MDVCVKMWQNGIGSLIQVRNDLFQIKNESAEIAKRWGVPTELPVSRAIRKRKFYDGTSTYTARKSVLSEEVIFIDTLIPVVEKLISQMRIQFESTLAIYQLFQFLMQSKILSMEDSELLGYVNRFCMDYKNDVSSNLYNEILHLKACMSTELRNTDKICNLLNLLIRYNLRESFPNLVTSCVLYLTLPVSVASAERSFSKLRLIKNYLCSKMLEYRLSGIAILSIESDRAQNREVDKMIDTFAQNKARRRPI